MFPKSHNGAKAVLLYGKIAGAKQVWRVYTAFRN